MAYSSISKRSSRQGDNPSTMKWCGPEDAGAKMGNRGQRPKNRPAYGAGVTRSSRAHHLRPTETTGANRHIPSRSAFIAAFTAQAHLDDQRSLRAGQEVALHHWTTRVHNLAQAGPDHARGMSSQANCLDQCSIRSPICVPNETGARTSDRNVAQVVARHTASRVAMGDQSVGADFPPTVITARALRRKRLRFHPCAN